MKRTLTATMFASLLLLGVGLRGHPGLGDAGRMPTVHAATPSCSLGTLKDSYGSTATGTIPGIGDIAAVGIFIADGAGHVRGADTVAVTNFGGTGVIEQRTFTGTYTVDADCTGTFTLQFAAPTFSGLVTADIIIVDKGARIRGIQTTPVPPAPTGVVLTFVAEQM
jgi:hypothetical protein